MNIIYYILLGLLQGFTEPLPISSSGHLTLFKQIFNTGILDDANFLIISNFGSFIAILIIFWKDIVDLIKAFFTFILKKDTRKNLYNKFKYCILIIIGTIPVGITGILFKDVVDNYNSPKILGLAFLITAIALFLVRNLNGKKKDDDLTYKDAIIIGLLQAVTIFPGISRSGTVLVGCLICGLSRETALKYTFMLYFPVSIASMFLGVFDIIEAGNLSSLLMPYTLGLIAAGIVTFFSYKWLSEWVKKGKLWKFSIYCLLLVIFIFIYFR
jgi:undecaprenyl-diphosphatase